jgi:hypothetical protein
MPEIKPKNISAQLEYRGRGNPPSAHPSSSIANCFPGLEFDFRNVWKRLFAGIELHESDNMVVSVEAGSEAAQQGVAFRHRLITVDGLSTQASVTGPRQVGEPDVTLDVTNLEWTNAVSEILSKAGQKVRCEFLTQNGVIEALLEVRNLFDGAAIAADAAEPGVLTQGLCSPWQADYRECGCYYWAASRPDFVNVEIDESQNRANGHNWMLKNRQPTTPKQYTPDNPADAAQVSYEDLYRNWENELRFIIEGRDET